MIIITIINSFAYTLRNFGEKFLDFEKEFWFGKEFLDLCEVEHRDPCHVLLAGILLPILDGDRGAMRFSAATGFFLGRLYLARSVRLFISIIKISIIWKTLLNFNRKNFRRVFCVQNLSFYLFCIIVMRNSDRVQNSDRIWWFGPGVWSGPSLLLNI